MDDELANLEEYCEKQFGFTQQEYQNKAENAVKKPKAKDARTRPSDANYTIEKEKTQLFIKQE